MQSKAATVEEYLASLPEDRRAEVQAVRKVILSNLGKGYREAMQYGMIGYCVPHTIYPAGYHCDPRQPLPFGGLAAQKNHCSVYLMCTYGHSGERAWFEKAWKATGKKLDMGAACIRFKKADDLALDVLGEAVRRMPVQKYIEHIEGVFANNRAQRARAKAGGAKVTKKAGKKKTATKSRA